MKFYDITFQEASGRSIVKREVPSEKKGFAAWQDACETIDEEHLYLLLNEKTYVILSRKQITAITAEEVSGTADKKAKRKDEIIEVINTLSNIGF